MRVPALAMLALSLLSGCGAEDTPASDRSAPTEDPGARLDDGAPDRLDPPAAGPAPASLSIALLPTLDRPVVGRVDLAAKGRSTSVDVWLGQGTPRTTYEGALRLGACDRLGPIVASLAPATADQAGVGTARSDIPVPMDSLAATGMAIVYGVGDLPSACGIVSAGAAAR